MRERIESILQERTGAREAHAVETLQQLWSGYGAIVRYQLLGAPVESVIVKHVSPPAARSHPRGWNTDRAHQRKLQSYAVETNWYQQYAAHCSAAARVPQCLAVERAGEAVIIVLEDLDAAGYPRRVAAVRDAELAACVQWLAAFHATFLGNAGTGLWETGSYWHLATRPDELAVLQTEDADLHAVAQVLDTRLKDSPYQTLVHGDAKLANFCFSQEGTAVAAVDFQYVGRGCGMKDLAYFIGSCFDEAACAAAEAQVLDDYFAALRTAVYEKQPTVDVDALEADWRALYPIAWTDFHRFLKGWSPGHWKVHGYSEALARSVITSLQEESL